jgi:hypothetical protein
VGSTLNRFASLLIGGLILMPGVAQAAGGQGLEISPPLLDLKADPGKLLTADVKVRNVTGETLAVNAQFEDFLANGEDGQPRILLNSKEKSPYSIKDWLSAPASVSLKPGERRTLALSINVPKNASPGGHYGLVRFTGTPPGMEETGLARSASVGTLILVNVSGDVAESAKIAEIYTSHKGSRRSLFEYGPVDITVRVHNTGNVHLKPKGTLQVTDMFGREVTTSHFNQTGRNVLPGSIRKFDQKVDKNILFGRYTVKADVVYGADNKIAASAGSFWVVPYKLVIAVVAAIAVLIFLAKRYNVYIIKRLQRQHNAPAKKTDKK